MGKADSKFSITTDIISVLSGDERISELVGGNIFPLVAKEGTQGDFITYQRDGYFIDRNKMGVHSQSCKLFVSAVSSSYARSVRLAELIYEALEGEFSGPDMLVHLEDSTEDSVDGKYIQILLFSIT